MFEKKLAAATWFLQKIAGTHPVDEFLAKARQMPKPAPDAPDDVNAVYATIDAYARQHGGYPTREELLRVWDEGLDGRSYRSFPGDHFDRGSAFQRRTQISERWQAATKDCAYDLVKAVLADGTFSAGERAAFQSINEGPHHAHDYDPLRVDYWDQWRLGLVSKLPTPVAVWLRDRWEQTFDVHDVQQLATLVMVDGKVSSETRQLVYEIEKLKLGQMSSAASVFWSVLGHTDPNDKIAYSSKEASGSVLGDARALDSRDGTGNHVAAFYRAVATTRAAKGLSLVTDGLSDTGSALSALRSRD